MTHRTRQFHRLVSGQQSGIVAAAARGVLRAIEVPYTCGVQWRNHRYDLGHLPATKVAVPVVSVGNLTLGGTGKTPMVKWIARWLLERKIRVAIVSRGYGTAAGTKNDEALELEQSLPDVPHVQNPDRVAAANRAIEKFSAQLILADDAFQHRRLHRDLNIVLVDAVQPFGFGHVFPRGTLREPIESLRRADLICLTRCDMVDDPTRGSIREQITTVAPGVPICAAAHRASGLIGQGGQQLDLTELQGAKVAAFCGIGNPPGFKHTLTRAGCEIAAWREFPDHHAYTVADMADLQSWAQASNAERIVCTHKDLVKLAEMRPGQMPLSAVTIEMCWHEGQSEMERALSEVLNHPLAS